ncbi:MAG: 23S rRNA (guanosine2251-2'-O)-methyltransferase [Candidatus Latescibacterota bacterium]|jgi:23S rRNA (guanosine2251-2'-O)-methyltransferase
MHLLSGDQTNPIYIIVENVRSLFNVGAIFRSADGINASGIYLTGFTGQPPRKEINRVALGADETVPYLYERDTLSVIQYLKTQNVQVIALEKTTSSVDYHTFAYQKPVAVIVGNEVEGIRPQTLEACDSIVHIPMCGQKISLNVSVASGIILYELLRSVVR